MKLKINNSVDLAENYIHTTYIYIYIYIYIYKLKESPSLRSSTRSNSPSLVPPSPLHPHPQPIPPTHTHSPDHPHPISLTTGRLVSDVDSRLEQETRILPLLVRYPSTRPPAADGKCIFLVKAVSTFKLCL